MAENILVSPLGRSPGAVSGVAFALNEHRENISRVITVGTSHPDVLTAAQYLNNLFADEFQYEAYHIPLPELRDRDGSADAFVSNMGLVLEEANRRGDTVHMAVTGGRAGMGALAALATNLYGAHRMWHFWVTDEIAEGGVIDKLQHPLTKDNKYLNPTVSDPEFYELVELPFADLRPLHPLIWHYHETGQAPDPDSPYFGLFASGELKQLTNVFPAGLTIGHVDYITEMAQKYPSLSPDEQLDAVEELGAILEIDGVVDRATRRRLRLMMMGDFPPEKVLEAVANAPDRTGFGAQLNNWLSENTERIQAIGTAASVISTIARIAQLWLTAVRTS